MAVFRAQRQLPEWRHHAASDRTGLDAEAGGRGQQPDHGGGRRCSAQPEDPIAVGVPLGRGVRGAAGGPQRP